MKAWKEELAQAIVDEFNSDSVIYFPAVGETDRAVKFSDVAKALGHNHIVRQDIRDISIRVQKLAPQLRPIRVVKNAEKIDPTESRWATLYFTDLGIEA